MSKKAWHEEAANMYRNGYSTTYIAMVYDKSPHGVSAAIKRLGVDIRPKRGTAKPNCRINYRTTGGFSMGTLKRVACSFTDDQVVAINAMCEANNMSFSAQVQAIVAAAISKAEGQ